MATPEMLIEAVRQWRIYAAWRAMRETQQTMRFNELMKEVAASSGRYAEPATAAALAARATSRRRPSHRCGIAAFGTNDWESKGLWPALESAGVFSLFDYAAHRGTGTAAQLRRSKGEAFLRHVDEREDAGRPVDVAFFYASGEHVDPQMLRALRERGIWSVLMSLDDKQQLVRVRTGDLRDWQIEVAREVDLYWTTWRAGADWLTAQNIPAWYAPEAADPDVHSHVETARDIDVLWLGRGYGRRLELIRYLRDMGFHIHAAGPGWPGGTLSFDDVLALIRRSHVVLGMGGVGQTDRVKHLKGRDFEVPMLGAVYLTSFNPELTDWFDVGSEILCYASFEECAEVLSWVLRRPDEAAKIRVAARARAVADHTWTARTEALLRLLGFQIRA